jgi:hypothetical protein
VAFVIASAAVLVFEHVKRPCLDVDRPKVSAANKLRHIYLIYKEDSSNATPSMANMCRSALETAYGQAVVSGKQSAVDYFKRLIDEYDSTLSGN